jgi:serpin B
VRIVTVRRRALAGLCAALALGLLGVPPGAASAKLPSAVAHRVPAAHRALSPAAATAAFGLDLMRVHGPGNVVLSPDSVATALAMVGTGAGGPTATQIARAMNLSSPRAFTALGSMQGTILAEQLAAASGNSEAPTLNIADALFLQQGFPLEPAFLSTLQQRFGAAPQSVDFEHDPAAATQAINTWVSEHTQGIIPEILAEPLPEATRLALANAIYLKAAWLDPFKAHDTAPAPFHGLSTQTVQFMHETDELRYGHGAGYAAVELPYAASTLSLAILLPVGRSVGALEHGLTAVRLASILRGLSRTSVSVSLPRFHLKSNTELEGSLEALGMTDAFGPAANFSGIEASEPLQIGQVVHAADFRVDEQGTIAAAATLIGVEPSSLEAAPHSVRFDADHPFLFFLRDDRTGTVLFAGRLLTPEAGE